MGAVEIEVMEAKLQTPNTSKQQTVAAIYPPALFRSENDCCLNRNVRLALETWQPTAIATKATKQTATVTPTPVATGLLFSTKGAAITNTPLGVTELDGDRVTVL